MACLTADRDKVMLRVAQLSGSALLFSVPSLPRYPEAFVETLEKAVAEVDLAIEGEEH